MPLPPEAAKGAIDKILSVQSPLVIRVLLPGLLGTAVLYPAVVWALGRFPSTGDYAWQQLALYAIMVLVLGESISTLNNEIYKIYEGRTWGPRLFEWGKKRQQTRVDKLFRATKNSKTTSDYDEAWEKLRDYPMNEKRDPEATHPTRIGNILAAYECYPLERYGMDSVFYWPRIWMEVDKEKKEAIDSQWAIADGLLSLSAVSVAGAVIWVVAAIVRIFGVVFPVPFGSSGLCMLGVLGWMTLGHFWYRLSLPFHRQNGELYKSIFDLYRGKIWDMTNLRPQEKETWEAAWSYLQYLYIKCPNCRKYTPVGSAACKECSLGFARLNDAFRKSGKIPM